MTVTGQWKTEGGSKWSDYGYTLNVAPTGFSDGLDME